MRKLLLVLAALLSLASFAQQERPIGMNLSFHTYYSPQFIFANMMKQSSYFKVQDVGESTFEIQNSFEQYPMRADGYPTQVPFTYNNQQCKVHVIILGGLLKPYEAGTYHLYFKGTGRVSVEWDAQAGSFTTPNVMHPVQVSPVMGMYGSGGVHLTIEESDVNDPIRDIQFLVPGTDTTDKFHPKTLELLKGMEVIRGIHALNTNRDDTLFITAGHQTPYDFYTQAASWKTGIHHRYLIELAQALDADVWMNFPVNVSDTLMYRVAQDFKTYLSPGQRVYIEYGNETWNFAPPFHYGAHWVNNRGLELGLSNNAYQSGRFYTARRSAEMFQIFDGVFAKDTARYVRTLGSHGQNPWSGLQELYGMTQPNINPIQSTRADALAIAPYWGGGVGDYLHNQNLVQQTTPDTILNYLQSEIDTTITKEVRNNKINTDNFGVRLICYESGQHLTTSFQNDTALISLMAATNRHPRMKDLYCQYYDMWYTESDGELMLAFNFVDNYSKYGFFGNLESMDQDTSTAPKWKALNECVFPYNSVGIDETNYSRTNQLYPNPGSDVINFQTPVEGTVKFYNLSGRLIFETGKPGAKLESVSTEKLPKGLYLVVTSAGSSKWLKN